jgi:hypothetical protein
MVERYIKACGDGNTGTCDASDSLRAVVKQDMFRLLEPYALFILLLLYFPALRARACGSA